VSSRGYAAPTGLFGGRIERYKYKPIALVHHNAFYRKVSSFVVLLRKSSYLQLVSGKAGDDAKGPERAKELLELSKIAKQKASSPSGSSIV
jgi:hypothetical protein